MKNVFVCSMLVFGLATSSLAQETGETPTPVAPGPSSNQNRGVRATEGVTSHRDLAYVNGGHERQKLDLYVPENASGPLPLIIWVHGGGWASGSKDGCPPLRSGYVQRGYAVASLDYRLSGDAIFPAQLEDCKTAIRWLRAHADEYHLNADRFAAWGSSAGGHLVAMLGTTGEENQFDVGEHLDQSSRVQAVCDYYGPTDLLQMDAHAIPAARMRHDAADSPESRLIGAPIQENPKLVARANPITYVTKDCPPFLIVHGDQDPTVAHHQSELLYDALKSAGIRVRFHTLEGAGHGSGFGGSELQSMVRNFFDRNLKDGPATEGEPLAYATHGPAVNIADAPRTEQRPQASGLQPTVRWDAVRRREDANADGRVTRDEFKGPQPIFNRFDRNRDGVLTEEDFDSAAVKADTPQP